MRKNSLNTTGLSMSQAQSVSNLCNQRGEDIMRELSVVNNASKTVKVNGEDVVTVTGRKLPSNVVDLLLEKASVSACQAFLMENIKAKENLLTSKRKEQLNYEVTPPEKPEFALYETLPSVIDSFGWSQLSVAETNEFLEQEARAAHIGRFIHKDSILENLRKELSILPTIEWMSIKDGEKTPVKLKIHHTDAELASLHAKLASLHREAEQRVNYFKAKVKNLTTTENARIAKVNAEAGGKANDINAKLNSEYQGKYQNYLEKKRQAMQEFEMERENSIKAIAAMRIQVDPRFQSVIDKFLDAE